MKVSALVSTYNSEQFIRGCLQDLVDQTLYQQGELEIIVIDSASPQNEKEIIDEFQSQYPNIIYERTAERETLYAAWNRGIKKASGVYITNANTDDRRYFEALAVMANYLDQHPEISVVYADQLITTVPNDTFGTTESNRHWNWPEYSYERLKDACCIGPQPMWRKSLHDHYGYFREEFYCAGDYEYWLRIGKFGEQMALLPEIFGLYYLNLKGLEHGKPQQSLDEFLLVSREYDIPRPYAPETIDIQSYNIDIESIGKILTQTEAEKRMMMQSRHQNNQATLRGEQKKRSFVGISALSVLVSAPLKWLKQK